MARERDAEPWVVSFRRSLAVALRQPGSAQLIPFKGALGCVRALVDFNMMAQYRSHTAETITYIEDYLDTFHKMKDIFLEF